MGFRNSTKAAAILLCMFVVSCGDKIADINPFDSEPTAEDVPEALAAAYCKRVFDCPYPFNGFIPRAAGTVDACREILEIDFRDEQRDRIRLIQAGRIAFDAEVFKTCLDYLEDCDHPLSDFDVFCSEAYAGSVQLGAGCRDELECAKGEREIECAIPTGMSCGTCAERGTVNLGGSCGGIVDCREDQTLGVLFCGEGNICVKREDAIFYDRELGEPCSTTIRSGGAHLCRHGLLCQPDMSGNGTCTELRSAGEPCGFTEHSCADGLWCAEPSETCEPNVRITTAGMRCDDDGPWCDSEANLACERGVCTPTNLPNGAACSRDLGSCSGACIDGVCSALRGSGEPCEFTRECEYPLYCLGADASNRICSMASGCE